MKGTLILLGWEIQVNPKRLSFDPPTTIRLHKLGEAGSAWFTPDELLTFAEALKEAVRISQEKAL